MAAPIRQMSTTSKPHGNRKFYDIPANLRNEKNNVQTCDTRKLIKYIDRNVIGMQSEFNGPFGKRQVMYCDYTASGRSLQFIEDYIQTEVLPVYGNTHTTTSVTSLQTTLFRHEARDIVRNSVNASEHDAVIFTGSGSTGAVHKLINALNFQTPPVVFLGPYEHHSNILPWRELGAKVIRIQENRIGLVDIADLALKLKTHASASGELVGCFSAASNVTGIMADVDAITVCLHKHGALAVWDYATSAPYTEVDMNPVTASEDQPHVYKDAILISTHKFVGGVGTPGILVAKKKLFRNPVPLGGGGGGSVFFVSRKSHRFLQEAEAREEAGTPAIVESIRAGLVMQLKANVTTSAIMQREHELVRATLDRWTTTPNLILFGDVSVPRLPIFSFAIKHPDSGLLLHHNYVCALLNDLFGIQARGGCACAGPYAQDLLGIDEEMAARIDTLLVEDSRLDRTHLRRYGEYSDKEILRPGFARINIPYFMDDEPVDFVIEAVCLVAEHGWKLLPQYIFNAETGEWRHSTNLVFKERKWLGSISYSEGRMSYPSPSVKSVGPLPSDSQECLNMARNIFEDAQKVSQKMMLADQTLLFGDDSASYRCFLLPSEAQRFLQSPRVAGYPLPLPYTPRDHGKEIPVRQLPGITPRADVPGGSDRANAGSNVREPRGEDADVASDVSCCCSTGTASDRAGRGHTNWSAGSHVFIPEMVADQRAGSAPCAKTENGEGELSGSELQPHGVGALSCKRPPQECTDRESAATDSRTGGVVGQPNWCKVPKYIFTPTAKAIFEYGMLKDGDRVLVCLSGGKDSLSLLHVLRQYRFFARTKGISFEFGAVTVDPQTPSYDPRPLIPYLAGLGVPYFYEEQDIMDTARALPECASICSFCSRMKRGRIYACARRHGYNVLALGQHLDDLAESFVMSIFHNGLMRTMKANYTVRKGDLRVIRPLVYVREKNTRRFAEEKKLPVIRENCPACFEAPKERHRLKQLLASQEVLFPNLYNHIRTAMKPLMAIQTAHSTFAVIPGDDDSYDSP